MRKSWTKLYDLGFKVQAPDFGFTESHQIALDVNQYGGGDEVARHPKDNSMSLEYEFTPL